VDALAGGVYSSNRVKTCGLALILFSDSVINRDGSKPCLVIRHDGYQMIDVPCPALNPHPTCTHTSMSVDEGNYRAETSVASLAPALALALRISKSPVGRSLVFDNRLLKRDNDSDNKIR